MDTLTFITEMAKAFAWPAAVVVLPCLLRPALQALIPTITKLKYKDFEADFSKDLRKVESEAKKAELPSSDEIEDLKVGGPETAAEKYRRLADISPRAAITEAWRDVELALRAVATGWDFDDPQNDSYPNLGAVIGRLVSEGKIDATSQHLLDHIRRLRNDAAHARDVDLTAEQAYQFALLASRITAKCTRKESTG